LHEKVKDKKSRQRGEKSRVQRRRIPEKREIAISPKEKNSRQGSELSTGQSRGTSKADRGEQFLGKREETKSTRASPVQTAKGFATRRKDSSGLYKRKGNLNLLNGAQEPRGHRMGDLPVRRRGKGRSPVISTPKRRKTGRTHCKYKRVRE